MKKRVVALLLAVLFIVPMLSGCGGSGGDSIVIYSCLEEFRNDDLKQKLSEKFPDLNIVLQYQSTGKLSAKLKAEGKNTDADIILAVEQSHIEMIKDNLATLDGYDTSHYLDGLNPSDKKYLIWERFAGAIVVNTDVLKEKGLPEPETYDDLLKPEYQNLIVMPDPKTSSTGYFFLQNLINLKGEDGAFAYFDELSTNIKQFTESSTGPIQSLVQGEAAIGLALIYHAVNEINDGAPLKIIVPPDGAPYSLDGVAMIDGKQTDEKVKQVFDYLVNEYIYYDKETFSPEIIFKDQKTTIENFPADVTYAEMQGMENYEERERLIGKWKY